MILDNVETSKPETLKRQLCPPSVKLFNPSEWTKHFLASILYESFRDQFCREHHSVGSDWKTGGGSKNRTPADFRVGQRGISPV